MALHDRRSPQARQHDHLPRRSCRGDPHHSVEGRGLTQDLCGPSVSSESPAASRLAHSYRMLPSRMTDIESTTATLRAPLQNTRGRVIFASLIGTTIEFYDFYAYATASVLVFPTLFFPR